MATTKGYFIPREGCNRALEYVNVVWEVGGGYRQGFTWIYGCVQAVTCYFMGIARHLICHMIRGTGMVNAILLQFQGEVPDLIPTGNNGAHIPPRCTFDAVSTLPSLDLKYPHTRLSAEECYSVAHAGRGAVVRCLYCTTSILCYSWIVLLVQNDTYDSFSSLVTCFTWSKATANLLMVGFRHADRWVSFGRNHASLFPLFWSLWWAKLTSC